MQIAEAETPSICLMDYIQLCLPPAQTNSSAVVHTQTSPKSCILYAQLAQHGYLHSLFKSSDTAPGQQLTFYTLVRSAIPTDSMFLQLRSLQMLFTAVSSWLNKERYFVNVFVYVY